MTFPDDYINRVIHGDCLEVMKGMPDKCVDLVLTDPPYGNNESYLSTDDTYENTKSLMASVMPEILRISKRVLLTPGVWNIHNYPKPEWILSWVTPAGTGRSSWGFSCWQPILAYGKCPYLAHGKGGRSDTFIHTEISEKNGHPCPKPIGIWTKILLRGSESIADIVFDPFCGSGTTLVAAKMLGRRYIGIDIEKKYCDIAEERLRNTTPPLPFTTEKMEQGCLS